MILAYTYSNSDWLKGSRDGTVVRVSHVPQVQILDLVVLSLLLVLILLWGFFSATGISSSTKTTTSKILITKILMTSGQRASLSNLPFQFLILMYKFIHFLFVLMIPGELSLSRMRKAPSNRNCKRASSAWFLVILPWNHL